MKEKKGITLIALIITIIILLILAGVSIAALSGNGIFKSAKDANEKTKIAQYTEEIELARYDANIEKETNPNEEIVVLDKMYQILKEQKLFEKSNFDFEDNTKKILIITTKEGYIFRVSDTGNEYIGKNSEEEKDRTLASKANIGDYVAYDPTKEVTDVSKLSYSSPEGTGISHGNGNSEQKFTANASLKWRVLCKDTSTGEVVLISEAPVGKLTLKGAIGYLYAEEELNKICSIYGYGKGANTSKIFTYQTGGTEDEMTTNELAGSGARSINVEDVNTITGYVVDTQYSTTKTTFYPTTKTQQGYTTSAESWKGLISDYGYSGIEYTTGTIYENMLFSNVSYFLSSRCTSSTEGITFFMRLVGNGNVFYNYLCGASSDEIYENPLSDNVRPIVYLKTNIKTDGKNSNGEWIIVEE